MKKDKEDKNNQNMQDTNSKADADGQGQTVKKEEFEKLQTELLALQDLAKRLEDQLKRAVADYHNLEKRVSEGRTEMSKWATGELMQGILPSLDNIEKAINSAPEEEKKTAWFKGVEMSLRQLQSILREEGLEEVSAEGQFDPALHEAVDTKSGEDNEILEVVEKGYTLHGKILKPARVVVGKAGKAGKD